MISKTMQNALNDQINAELWSAYLYLSMSMDAEAKALRGIAHWFFVQWLEEQDHARILQNYINAQGARVSLKPLQGVQQEWDGPLDMFRDTLRHEQQVTGMITDLVRLALDESDFATLSRLQWFVDEQIEEEEEATSHIIDLNRADDDAVALKMFDNAMGERHYKRPVPLSDR